jgi:hypothetical protein
MEFFADKFRTCLHAHASAARAALSWAKLWTRGSPRWSASLERAISECSLSENFISAEEQTDVYADLKRVNAMAYTERAMGKVQAEGAPLSDLQAALQQLSTGIASLTQAGRDAKKLYQERSQCYRRMATYSNRPEDRQKYTGLALKDQRASRNGPHHPLEKRNGDGSH